MNKNIRYIKSVNLSAKTQDVCKNLGSVLWRNKKVYCLYLEDDKIVFGYEIDREQANYIHIERYIGMPDFKYAEESIMNIKNVSKDKENGDIIFDINHIILLADIEYWGR